MKQINEEELLEIVQQLLSDPDQEQEKVIRLMEGVATAVCGVEGGEVVSCGPTPAPDTIDGRFYVSIEKNDSLPSDGGVWANYDPSGSWVDDDIYGEGQ